MEWQPIETIPRNGEAFRAYGASLVDEDFNPLGQVEAVYVDGEEGYILGAIWNNYQDCWDTEIINPTHWQPFPQSPKEGA